MLYTLFLFPFAFSIVLSKSYGSIGNCWREVEPKYSVIIRVASQAVYGAGMVFGIVQYLARRDYTPAIMEGSKTLQMKISCPLHCGNILPRRVFKWLVFGGYCFIFLARE
jgi:hypothetical protein